MVEIRFVVILHWQLFLCYDTPQCLDVSRWNGTALQSAGPIKQSQGLFKQLLCVTKAPHEQLITILKRRGFISVEAQTQMNYIPQ